MKLLKTTGLALAALMLTTAGVAMAEPAMVAGPAEEAECYVPWDADTAFFQYPAKTGPFRVALANGYIANTWRIQMIQTAKAYAAQPDVAAKLKEFKVVSTGEMRAETLRLADAFHAKVVDATVEHFIFEITGKSSKIDQFVSIMKPLGLNEICRTGIAAMNRGSQGM